MPKDAKDNRAAAQQKHAQKMQKKVQKEASSARKAKDRERKRDQKYRDRDAERKHLEEMERIKKGSAVNRGVQTVSKSAATVLTAGTGLKSAGEVAGNVITDGDIKQYNELIKSQAPSDLTNGSDSNGVNGGESTGSTLFVP